MNREPLSRAGESERDYARCPCLGLWGVGMIGYACTSVHLHTDESRLWRECYAGHGCHVLTRRALRNPKAYLQPGLGWHLYPPFLTVMQEWPSTSQGFKATPSGPSFAWSLYSYWPLDSAVLTFYYIPWHFQPFHSLKPKKQPTKLKLSCNHYA